MARKQKHKKFSVIPARRALTTANANHRLYRRKKLQRVIPQTIHSLPPLSSFENYQDNRLYSGGTFTVEASKSRNYHLIETKTGSLGFQNPKSLILCNRRARRRQVLFALRRGGGGNRPPKFTQLSKISCKG